MKFPHFLVPAMLVLAPAAALSQTATLVLGSAATSPGVGVSLNLSLNNVGSLGGLSALEFSLTYSASEFSSVAIAAGAAVTGKSKSLKCRSSVGRLDCAVWGLNQNLLADGVVASVTVTPSTASSSTSRTVTVARVTGAAGTGILTSPLATTSGVVSVSAPGGTVTLSGLTCAPSTIGPVSSTTCTVVLSGAAPSETSVSITRDTTRLTVPSSVTIPAGSTSASFTATTGSFTTASTGTITATWGAVSRQASLSLVTSPVLQSLVCTPAILSSGAASSCTVSLSSAALSNTTVAIAKDSALVTVPLSVTIATGQVSAVFTATAGTILADATATLTASWNGTTRTQTLTLTTPPVPTSLECNPSVLNPSQQATCRVQLSKAVGSSTTVALSRTSSRISVGSSVTVHAGASSAEFTATAHSVSSLTEVEIRATLNSVRATTIVTVSNQSCPCSLFDPSSVVPQWETSSDTSAVELGMKFQSKMSGYILGLRFLKGPLNTGTHSGRLWTANGTQLASVTFANETSKGWQTAYFSTPVAIAANTTYIVSYRAPVGRYSVDRWFFHTAGTSRGPLSSPRSGDAGGNGVYTYGSIAFPNSTYAASNYWVDVIFNTLPGWTPGAIPYSTGVEGTEQISVSSFSLRDRPEGGSADADAAELGPDISVPQEEFAKPGERVSFIVRTRDDRPADAVALPSGATLDPVTSQFEWTPEGSQQGDHTLVFQAQDAAEAATRIVVGSGTPEIASVRACRDGVATIVGRWLGPDADLYTDRTGESLEVAGVRVRIDGVPVPLVRVSRTEVDFLCPGSLGNTEANVLIETPTGSTALQIGVDLSAEVASVTKNEK